MKPTKLIEPIKPIFRRGLLCLHASHKTMGKTSKPIIRRLGQSFFRLTPGRPKDRRQIRKRKRESTVYPQITQIDADLGAAHKIKGRDYSG